MCVRRSPYDGFPRAFLFCALLTCEDATPHAPRPSHMRNNNLKQRLTEEDGARGAVLGDHVPSNACLREDDGQWSCSMSKAC